jgi:hypothetical protein
MSNYLYIKPENFLTFPITVDENFKEFLIDPKLKTVFNRDILFQNVQKLSKEEKALQNKQYYNLRLYLNKLLTNSIHGRPQRIHQPLYKIIGCDIVELRQHLEKQFTGGMSWQTYGKSDKMNPMAWFVQHILPHKIFNLTDPVEVKQYMHYTNLRPCLWVEHRSRGKSVYRDLSTKKQKE